MLEIIRNAGIFYNNENKQSNIVIYGSGNAGKVFTKYLVQEGYNVCCICDRNIEQGILNIPVIQIGGLDINIRYAILLLTRSEKFEAQMLGNIDELGLCCSIYGWEAFCLKDNWKDKRGVDFITGIPWYFTRTFECENPKAYIKDFEEWIMDQYFFSPEGGYFYNADIELPTLHLNGGMRRTIEPLPDCQNTIFMFGDSRIFGFYLHDEDTISSKLQDLLIKNGRPYEVQNLGVIGETLDNMFAHISRTHIKTGDIVIINDVDLFIDNSNRDAFWEAAGEQTLTIYINYYIRIKQLCDEKKAELLILHIPQLKEISNKSLAMKTIHYFYHVWNRDAAVKSALPLTRIPAETMEILSVLRLKHGISVIDLANEIKADERGDYAFIDNLHFGTLGAEIAAESIFHKIFELTTLKMNINYELCEVMLYKLRVERVLAISKEKGYDNFEKYLSANAADVCGETGCIVMNANPFTKGHQYLAEYAASKVKWLYIFVVEEDKSYFPFEDRMAMVKAGTGHLKNVTVLRSGRLIISSATFPEYFRQDRNADCSNDLMLFAMVIAPKLKIKKRFVGEEPFSEITDSYNRQMKEILPRYGIEVTEIPRIKCDDTEISASRVREFIAHDDRKKLKQYVPRSTFLYIQNQIRK